MKIQTKQKYVLLAGVTGFVLGICSANLWMKEYILDIGIFNQFFLEQYNRLEIVYEEYFWCIGQSFSMIASEKAGAAISYGLGQGATLVSALWGILIWHEFRRAPRSSDFLNAGMFVLFVTERL